MPRPSGLVFKHRLAPYQNGHVFLCQKVGHKPLQRLIRGTLRDAQQVVQAHDALYHNYVVRAAGIHVGGALYIGELVDGYLAHVERLVDRGKLSRKTHRHYRYMSAILRDVFGKRERIDDLKPDRISRAAQQIDGLIETRGATVVKVLSALRQMLAWKGLPQSWQIPLHEIDPEPMDKRELTMEQILWLLRHTPGGSVEEAAIALKMRTGMREVEIAAANVGDYDPDHRTIAPVLRSKSKRRKPRRHVYVLAEDVAELIEAFTVDRPADQPLLHLDGRRLQESTLRRRLIAASRTANAKLEELVDAQKISEEEYRRKLIDPPLRGLKPIRAEVATVITEEMSLKEAAEWIGHRDESTLERWYLKSRQTAAQLEQKRRIADVLQRVAPLPERDVDVSVN